MGLAPVFLGAEDHPPRDRRPKCLTGSAITLVHSARPNPRGRHARVADPSGVECQRDGSDQGQRMEAGDGALTPRRQAPCPVTGCQPLASRAAKLVSKDRHVPDRVLTNFNAAHEYEAGSRARPDLWHQAATRRTSRHRPPSGWISRRTRDRCPNGGRLPSRLQSDDQSPVPALPGCAKTSFSLSSNSVGVVSRSKRHSISGHLHSTVNIDVRPNIR